MKAASLFGSRNGDSFFECPQPCLSRRRAVKTGCGNGCGGGCGGGRDGGGGGGGNGDGDCDGGGGDGGGGDGGGVINSLCHHVSVS